MDIIFENTLVRNKATAKRLYRYMFFRQPAMVIINLICFLCFLINLALVIWTPSTNWAVLVLVPVYFVFQYYRYASTASMMLKRDRETFGGEITLNIQVTDTHLQQAVENNENSAVSKVELTNIKKAVFTKHLILIYTKAKLIYVLSKDAFQIGDAEGFYAFLQSKNIKVKGK